MVSCQNEVRIIPSCSHLFSKYKTPAWPGNMLWNKGKAQLVEKLEDSSPCGVNVLNVDTTDFSVFLFFIYMNRVKIEFIENPSQGLSKRGHHCKEA